MLKREIRDDLSNLCRFCLPGWCSWCKDSVAIKILWGENLKPRPAWKFSWQVWSRQPFQVYPRCEPWCWNINIYSPTFESFFGGFYVGFHIFQQCDGSHRGYTSQLENLFVASLFKQRDPGLPWEITKPRRATEAAAKDANLQVGGIFWNWCQQNAGTGGGLDHLRLEECHCNFIALHGGISICSMKRLATWPSKMQCPECSRDDACDSYGTGRVRY